MNSSVMEEPTTILVVDDEKVIRDGCILALKPEGYRVTTAENGQEALEVLARESVQVVLCDLKMPVMGALEVLEEMAKHYPDIPVIIMTGHGTVDNAVECMHKGAYDFVTKPFSIDHLILWRPPGPEQAPPGAARPGSSRRSGPGTSTTWPWSRAACTPSSTAWATACW